MEIRIKKLDENVILPEYKTNGSAGMDICANENAIIQAGQIKLISTGIAVAIENGFEVQVRARSGLSTKHGITCINGIGTIDSDYRGEIGVPLINLGKSDFIINKGDRIAQLVVNKIEQPEIKVVEELDDTERGEGGFGSTGVNDDNGKMGA